MDSESKQWEGGEREIMGEIVRINIIEICCWLTDRQTK